MKAPEDNTNEKISEIKNEITNIINSNNDGMCLCGHKESCDICSPSPRYTKLVKNLTDYLNKI